MSTLDRMQQRAAANPNGAAGAALARYAARGYAASSYAARAGAPRAGARSANLRGGFAARCVAYVAKDGAGQGGAFSHTPTAAPQAPACNDAAPAGAASHASPPNQASRTGAVSHTSARHQASPPNPAPRQASPPPGVATPGGGDA